VRLPAPPVLLITDRRQARRPLVEVIAAALAGGCRWVSVREKDLPGLEQIAVVREIGRIALPFGACVMIHGEPGLAAEAGCTGVHLPATGSVRAARALLGPEAWVSISTHGLAEVLAAADAGADAATLSPIFASVSKPGYGPALGLEALAGAATASPIPVIALGGIEGRSEAEACRRAGAGAVAVMGAVMRTADPAALVAELIRAVDPSATT
jgi:thiamine-phosphate pyrophosphorylase